ncbi:hypothetical protein ES703_66901 [subsurface metagenome]
MTGKTRLYIGLLVVGLVLVGSGLWLLLNPVPRINVPESTPVIAMDITHTMGGTRSQPVYVALTSQYLIHSNESQFIRFINSYCSSFIIIILHYSTVGLHQTR